MWLERCSKDREEEKEKEKAQQLKLSVEDMT
jgi:hypothetical protein